MSYLIDGNNVMAQRVGWHKDKPGSRRRLLEELALLVRVSGLTVEVVFDGAPDEFFPDGSSFMGVRVFYAERGSNADERIKKLVEASRERRTLKVVTSDRALADYVRRCGVEVLRSGEFRRRLDAEVAASKETASKESEPSGHGGVKESEVDEWMYYFGVAPEDEEAAGGRESSRGGAKKSSHQGAKARARRNRRKR
jgi:predicted RNA-binding protein with PIN domain